jgi:hypothetical protein
VQAIGRRRLARAFQAAILTSALFLHIPAWPARAADVVEKSFTYRANAARAFAALLELPSAARPIVEFDLSQGAEHRALPERDEALRDPGGALSPELEWRTSTEIHETATWDAATGILRLDGYVADVGTALPAQEGPAWRFSSPWFTESDVDHLPHGWGRLLLKLSVVPGTAMPGGAVVRKIDVALGGAERAVLSLWRVQTWDSKNDPVLKSYLRVEFGPPVGARGSEPGDGGRSRSCGCTAGRAEGGGWACLGAVLLLARRRRAYFA